MNDKDMEIANLKGQLEAYQKQMKSMALDLLRQQVTTLEEENRKKTRQIDQLQRQFSAFKTEANDRITKAGRIVRDLQSQMESTLTAKE